MNFFFYLICWRGSNALKCCACSHNFLNQKPWHPLNFRNQARVYEAEQEAIRQAKANQQAKVSKCKSLPDQSTAVSGTVTDPSNVELAVLEYI
jgi:N-terminal domain of CBF1 interacting co-repressor CIR